MHVNIFSNKKERAIDSQNPAKDPVNNHSSSSICLFYFYMLNIILCFEYHLENREEIKKKTYIASKVAHL